MSELPNQREQVEKYLINQILKGVFPVGSPLPGERELAERLQVSRVNVRSTLQKMAAAGWVRVNERHATVVKNFWQDGNLSILADIAEKADEDTFNLLNFIPDLLEVRLALAPHYARAAVAREPLTVVKLLTDAFKEMSPRELAIFDWKVHLSLARLSGNRVYPLLLNSFTALALKLGEVYFNNPAGRTASRKFYEKLMRAAVDKNAEEAFRCTAQAMNEALELWQEYCSTR